MTVVVVLESDRGRVRDGAVEADLVEPPHPVQGGELDVVDVVPWPLEAEALGFVEPDERFSESVIVRIADGPDRRDSAGVDEAVRVPDRRVLGGLNRSSQHLDGGGVDGKASRMDERVDGPFADEVSGCAIAA